VHVFSSNFYIFPPLVFVEMVEQRRILVEHLRTVLRRPEFQHAFAIVGVETNGGMFGDTHEDWINLDPEISKRCVVLHERRHVDTETLGCGIYTTSGSKFSSAVNSSFALDNDQFRIAKNVVCVHGKASEKLAMLQDQMNVFAEVIEPPTTKNGKGKRYITGKHAGQNDDLAMAFTLQSLARSYFFSPWGRKNYANYHT